jgi:[acyl-carrier-protein] S-malonyltransferase
MTIRKLLVEQVTGRVRWRESIEWMATRAASRASLKSARASSLSGMVKRNAPDAETLGVERAG